MGGLRDRDPRGCGRRRDDDDRHAAQLDPADHDGRRAGGKQAAAAGQCFVDVGFWGGAVPGNLADLEPLHEAGVFGFKCFLLDSGVDEFPHLRAEAFAAAMAETARLGALMIVHAEDGELIDETRSTARATRASWPRGRVRRGGRDRAGRRAGTATGGAPTSSTSATRTPCPRAALGARRRRRRLGGDLPALPDLRGRAGPRRATELKAARRSARPTTARRCGRRSGRATSTRRVRPLAVHGDAEGERGLRAGLGRHRLGAAGPAGGVDRGQRPRLSLVDVVRWMATAPADRAGLSPQGRIEAGADADLCVRTRRRVRR